MSSNCPACRGTGIKPSVVTTVEERCPRCRGKGSRRVALEVACSATELGKFLELLEVRDEQRE